MRVRSTSNMQWTCALVRRDSIMRWAMILRIWRHGNQIAGNGAPGVGSRRSRVAGAAAATAAGAGLQRLTVPSSVASFEESHDVLLGDAAAEAGAGNLRQVRRCSRGRSCEPGATTRMSSSSLALAREPQRAQDGGGPGLEGADSFSARQPGLQRPGAALGGAPARHLRRSFPPPC